MLSREGNKYRLIYFDESGFSSAPPVQNGWGPRGQPHRVEPKPHCRRSALGALDFSANTLSHKIIEQNVTRKVVVDFLEDIAQKGEKRYTFVVLDNASIHHGIEQETLKRWFMENNMVLIYLPAYTPELNLIEIVWKQAKYHWRCLVTWSKRTINTEINRLLSSYGDIFAVNFLW